jgi:hypothetical protein
MNAARVRKLARGWDLEAGDVVGRVDRLNAVAIPLDIFRDFAINYIVEPVPVAWTAGSRPERCAP